MCLDTPHLVMLFWKITEPLGSRAWLWKWVTVVGPLSFINIPSSSLFSVSWLWCAVTTYLNPVLISMLFPRLGQVFCFVLFFVNLLQVRVTLGKDPQ